MQNFLSYYIFQNCIRVFWPVRQIFWSKFWLSQYLAKNKFFKFNFCRHRTSFALSLNVSRITFSLIMYCHTYNLYAFACYSAVLWKLSWLPIYASPIIYLHTILALPNLTLLCLRYVRHFIIHLPQLWTVVIPFCHSFSLFKLTKK